VAASTAVVDPGGWLDNGEPMPSTRRLNVLARIALATTFLTAGLALTAGPPASAAAPGYEALTPARVLDTRQGLGAAGPVTAGGSITVDVTGAHGVPDSGVAAVVLNVTAAEATTSTYVTVWPSGEPQPGTSNLNVQPGVDTPNLVIATVGADGNVSLANQFGTVQLIADVTGWFPTGSDYHALTPNRVLDTRQQLGAAGPVPPVGQISVDLTGVGGVPDSGVAAVVLNVTAAAATDSTYVTVWPAGQSQPNTSNLNVQPGVDTPNLVIATVGADGRVSLANQFGSVHLIADVTGWFPTGSTYGALTPDRILDTRSSIGAVGPVPAGGSIRVPVTGVGGVPATGVGAVVLNVTAAAATESTYVTVWPTGQPQPNTSNLNVRPGVDTPNLVIATVGSDGTVSLANQFGSVHLIADVAGWLPGTPAPPPPPPVTGNLYFDGLASVDRLDLANGQRTIVYNGQDDNTQIGYNASEFAFGTDEGGGVLTVEIRDLATGGPKTSFGLNTYNSGKPVMPSPDGQWIAMVIPHPEDSSEPDVLVVVQRDGTPRRAIERVSSAAWTADGRLAVVRLEAGNGRLDIFGDALSADFDTYWSAPLGSYDDLPTDLTIAPNGARAAFALLGRVYGLTLDGTSQPYVAAESALDLSAPAFSPDSSLLVVHRADGFFCAGSMHVVPASPAAPIYIPSSDSPTLIRDADGAQVSSCGSIFWHP
jgi:hypothetical protein